MSNTLRLTEQLMAMPSVTPTDGGCTALIQSHLDPLGFACEVIDCGPDTFRVKNLWAKRAGTTQQTLAFAGHVDVVPTGPLSQWTSDPFTPTHKDGKLFGRGASDMKTSLAAMVDWRNEHSQGHIITVEEPIEYVHPRISTTVITQREVGRDVDSFYDGLKYGLCGPALSCFKNESTLRIMSQNSFLFDKKNYLLFAIGLAFIVLGFILMSGGGSEDPNVYNEELFSSRLITWAPLLIVIGFVVEVFAILRRPKS